MKFMTFLIEPTCFVHQSGFSWQWLCGRFPWRLFRLKNVRSLAGFPLLTRPYFIPFVKIFYLPKCIFPPQNTFSSLLFPPLFVCFCKAFSSFKRLMHARYSSSLWEKKSICEKLMLWQNLSSKIHLGLVYKVMLLPVGGRQQLKTAPSM